MLRGKHELKKEEILPVCLYQKKKEKKIRQSVIMQKNFARCGPENFAQATKAGNNQEMWLEEPMEERERRVCEPLKDYGRVVARHGKRR